jgi:hypothetical protein
MSRYSSPWRGPYLTAAGRLERLNERGNSVQVRIEARVFGRANDKHVVDVGSGVVYNPSLPNAIGRMPRIAASHRAFGIEKEKRSTNQLPRQETGN